MKRKDMPTFGQLGCSGFIIIGADGECVSKKTKSFLEYGEQAFTHAENVILTALEDAGVDLDLNAAVKGEENQYANGQRLRLEGISSDPTLNGQIVTVINFDKTKRRFNVLLSDGSNRRFSVLPCSLKPLTTEENENTTSENQVLKQIQPPNQVGLEVVDEEHAACTESINQCLRSGTRKNLASLLVCLEKHFQHEETLALESGFGSVTESLSPMFGHAKDHARILNLARSELERTAQYPDSSDVNVGVVQTLASSFLEHAKNFDSLLEGKLQVH